MGLHLSEPADTALADLLAALDACGYDFVAPTPATHSRVVARPNMRQARDLRGIFGWSLPFRPELLPAELFEAMREARLLTAQGDLFKSQVRVSRLRGRLFLHSAFPTDAEDSVFLGPDSYRFSDFVSAELASGQRHARLVDLGGGAGVGALSAAAFLPQARLTLLDLNPAALRLAAVNARHAGLDIELVEGGSLADIAGLIDIVIANPPFVIDEGGRTYRDGGGMHGAEISLEWALSGAERIEAGGKVLLYTGAAIIDGRDPLREMLASRLPALGCTLAYRQIDPDIFGEELERPAYRAVERIAAVAAVIEKLG